MISFYNQFKQMEFNCKTCLNKSSGLKSKYLDPNPNNRSNQPLNQNPQTKTNQQDRINETRPETQTKECIENIKKNQEYTRIQEQTHSFIQKIESKSIFDINLLQKMSVAKRLAVEAKTKLEETRKSVRLAQVVREGEERKKAYRQSKRYKSIMSQLWLEEHQLNRVNN